jgi:hypothetical protein
MCGGGGWWLKKNENMPTKMGIPFFEMDKIAPKLQRKIYARQYALQLH